MAAEEVSNILDQILRIANTKLGNSYIFAGHKTDTTPFPDEGNPDYAYKGDAGEIKILVGESADVRINASGDEVFAGDTNIFSVLKDLEDGLRNNDTEKISVQIERIDDGMDQILNARAVVGERLNLLETTENYWINFKIYIEQMLAETEDADITKAIADLATLESAYQASLAAAAKIVQPSLLQFLR
jgi:flagellar hook-associated protein 3 FlgL